MDRFGESKAGVRFGGTVGRCVNFLATLGAALVVLASPGPATAWYRGPFGPGVWAGPSWRPFPAARIPGALPYGSRFHLPPGFPLSYNEPGSGETYCLSRPTGFYYMCGYSPPPRDSGEPAYRVPPAAVLAPGEQGLPLPSGVLLFRLPQGAEAEVDGLSVGLSEGLGITSVPPGRHRVVVRAAGAETEHTVTVGPRAIFTVTPTAVVAGDR